MAKTRQQKQKQMHSTMTIPQLRKSFDHIEEFTMKLLTHEKNKKKQTKAFQEEWMRVFHRSIDEKAADAYLQFEGKKAIGRAHV